MKTRELHRKIRKATDGLVHTSIDLVLLYLSYGIASAACYKYPSQSRVAKKMDEIDPLLTEIDYNTLKRTLYHLKKTGLIEYVKEEGLITPAVTAEGRKRLESKLPYYQKQRPWNGKIYLITYDIPEEQKPKRDKFREFISKIGCGKLQASVWLTPYNPRALIKEYVKENYLDGDIIVSNIGKDGNIGKRTVNELVLDVYKLNEINYEYLNFVKKFKEQEINEASATRASITYLAILDKDPQLPFELLPLDWAGERARNIYLKFTTENTEQ